MCEMSDAALIRFERSRAAATNLMYRVRVVRVESEILSNQLVEVTRGLLFLAVLRLRDARVASGGKQSLIIDFSG